MNTPPKYIGFDIIDQYQCACGWKTKPYYDGAEYAMAEWRKHLKKCSLLQPTPLWQWVDDITSANPSPPPNQS